MMQLLQGIQAGQQDIQAGQQDILARMNVMAGTMEELRDQHYANHFELQDVARTRLAKGMGPWLPTTITK